MRRLLYLSATASFAFWFAAPAMAWGPEGHAIIADIAQVRLTPAAKREVKYLLSLRGDVSLDQVASLPDKWIARYHETAPWHYVDIPLDASGYKASRDCPRGDCSVAKLPFFVHVLADRRDAPRVRLRALIYVVHLTGDMYQPLHNENHHDRGGNEVKLHYFGKPTELHAVWDSGIIEHALDLYGNPDYTVNFAPTFKAAMKLNKEITSAEEARWTPKHPVADIDAEVVRWANHGHMLARTIAYADLPTARERHEDKNWSATYQRKTWPVVRTQLQSSAVHLAALINAALRPRSGASYHEQGSRASTMRNPG